MRTRAKFAGFRANYLCGVAAGSLVAVLGLLNSVSAANAEDGAFLPPSWFTLPTLTFDAAARPGVDVAYKTPKSFWTENPSTRLRIEYLMLQRKGPGGTALTVANGPSRFVPVSSSIVDSGSKTTPGFRATIDAELFDAPVEFSGFYTAPFRNEVTLSGLSTGSGTSAIRTNTTYADSSLNPGGAPFNYTNSQTINSLYLNHSSQLFGAEANAKSVFGIPGLMLGVRSIYFGDELSSVATKFNSTTAIDAVSVQSRNFLLGPQIGFEGMFDIGGGIRIGGSAKVGLFANMVERERSYISRNQTQSRALQNFTNDTTFAQGYELNPRIEVPLMQGVKLTAGGTFLWLNNVSTAFPQYATVTDVSDRNVRAKDRIFYYGVQAGVSVDLDTLAKFSPPPMSRRYLEAKMLESQGATPLPFMVYGEINRMALSWDDGVQSRTRAVDNYSAPSIFGARVAAEIARGWTTGGHAEMGFLQARSIAVSQDLPGGETGWAPDLRYLDWFIRSNRYGTLTVGHTSTATDGIVLNDFSGTNAAASANIAMIGGDLMLRAADALDTGSGSLITRTSIGDFVGGATIDTLRRNVAHYETPVINGFQFDVAAREKFWDAALSYRADLPNWRFRAGVGYVRDTEGTREDLGFRKDRREWKGSASLLHNPTGLFVTTAFVNRQFRGFDSSNQAVFGENMVDVLGNVIPGTHRPDMRYGYLKTGLRRQFNALGDTKFYAETALAKNGLTGLREGGPKVVTASQLNMVGAGVMQDIDAYNTQVYLGYRHYSFNIEGLRDSSSAPGGSIASPAPIKDINLVFSGIRIKF
ncbi:hypothetical protein AFIC_000144 [[Pseudomonas] carboxydohydrogena]|uniref:Porin domain-containing protein n=1 Tax=Afipia carboxydohydrogena TaxID=290 RepID=A0ABY8BNZ4_AFICR|nr:porin [[Pseudomonas] carboxydohydrogena]WEF51699.1 hypothetical protein AFIC_000144 [[Pseudomonas] carboxydohydrogena]